MVCWGSETQRISMVYWGSEIENINGILGF